ncbi:Sad1-interacting factor 1 [Cytospora mali]|uniref:Sad1-interacting factor 1 n=1 Tax=Cytospora mali TaxID=578113 RepID=A0A194V291_CYTMA|nr:Sad1-interacting factor 1 [Valsa mali var. pyri (nom. inval.)]
MDTAGMSPEDAASARAAEQARLRKERREAKIKAGGSARLNKITGLGGGIQRDPLPTTPTSTTSSPLPTPTATSEAGADLQHGDPDEVDISQHYYQPQTANRIPSPLPSAGGGDPNNISEDQLRQMMLGFDPSSMAGGPGGPDGPDGEDPMMKMLTQMLGPGAVPPNFGGAGGSNPFAGGNPFAGMQPPQQQQQQQAVPDTYAAMWRILHFYFFWTFGTAETVLLTSRFLLDGRRGAPPGILGTLLGFLPEGVMKSMVGTGMKYSRIFSTVRSDILVCVFVLGICSWVRG